MYPSKGREMAKKRMDIDLDKIEWQLRKAQKAKKSAETAAHQPFLDEIRASVKYRRAVRIYKRKISRLIVAGIKQQVKKGKLNRM